MASCCHRIVSDCHNLQEEYKLSCLKADAECLLALRELVGKIHIAFKNTGVPTAYIDVLGRIRQAVTGPGSKGAVDESSGEADHSRHSRSHTSRYK